MHVASLGTPSAAKVSPGDLVLWTHPISWRPGDLVLGPHPTQLQKHPCLVQETWVASRGVGLGMCGARTAPWRIMDTLWGCQTLGGDLYVSLVKQ